MHNIFENVYVIKVSVYSVSFYLGYSNRFKGDQCRESTHHKTDDELQQVWPAHL